MDRFVTDWSAALAVNQPNAALKSDAAQWLLLVQNASKQGLPSTWFSFAAWTGCGAFYGRSWPSRSAATTDADALEAL